MSIWAWVIIGIVALAILFVIFRIMKSCLPKIVVFLLVLAVLAFVVYWYAFR